MATRGDLERWFGNHTVISSNVISARTITGWWNTVPWTVVVGVLTVVEEYAHDFHVKRKINRTEWKMIKLVAMLRQAREEKFREQFKAAKGSKSEMEKLRLPESINECSLWEDEPTLWYKKSYVKVHSERRQQIKSGCFRKY